MRRILPILLLCAMPVCVLGVTQLWLPPAQYGASYTLYFGLEDFTSSADFYETAPAAADVHVFQDGASEARAANAVTDLGRSFSLVLTAAEMTARVVTVDVNDSDAPHLFKHAIFYIPTYGHASAYHIFDYSKDLDPNIQLILADTNDVQEDWADGGRLDTILDVIVADTNEIQEDWTNGGRLDLLLDAVKAMTDLMAVVTTTVNTVTDANTFTLVAGEDVNDAYAMHAIMVQDATDSHSEVRWIQNYVTSRTVTVNKPLSFTPEAADKAWILGPVYGGFLSTLETMLQGAQAPIYYWNRSSGTTGASGVTYFNQKKK